MTKPIIVTRVGKGSPLSVIEGDSNFTNLRDSTFGFVVDGTTITNELNSAFTIESGLGITVTGNNSTKKVTISNSKVLANETAPVLGGNLDVETFKIVTNSLNRNIELLPHGTGKVKLGPNLFPSTVGTAGYHLMTDGAGVLSWVQNVTALIEDIAPILGANLDVSTFKIVTNSNNRNIELDPHGTGVVAVTGPMTISGNLTVNGTTTTVNSTTVDIADLNITLAKGATTAAAANGAGFTIEGPATPAVMEYVSATDRFLFNKQIAGSFFSNAASNFSGGTVNLGSNSNVTLTGGSLGQVLRTDGSGNLTWVNQSAGGIASVSADTTPALGGNLNVGTNSITTSTTDGNITLAPNGTGAVRIGDGTFPGKITTNGNNSLILNTNGGTNSGIITMVPGINGNILISPNSGGTGKVRFYSAYSFPNVDGTANQYLKTDGAGELTWASVSAGFVGTATSDLNMATFKIKTTATQNLVIETSSSTYGMEFKSNTNKFGYLDSGVSITTNGTGSLSLSTNSNSDSGSIVINPGINANIGLNPNGTGKIMLNGLVGITATTGTPTTFNTSYFEGTLDTPASWLKIAVGASNYYLPMFQ